MALGGKKVIYLHEPDDAPSRQSCKNSNSHGIRCMFVIDSPRETCIAASKIPHVVDTLGCYRGTLIAPEEFEEAKVKFIAWRMRGNKNY